MLAAEQSATEPFSPIRTILLGDWNSFQEKDWVRCCGNDKSFDVVQRKYRNEPKQEGHTSTKKRMILAMDVISGKRHRACKQPLLLGRHTVAGCWWGKEQKFKKGTITKEEKGGREHHHCFLRFLELFLSICPAKRCSTCIFLRRIKV